MSAKDNELKFTATLDASAVIKTAKVLAKEIREATKVKSDNPIIAKAVELLSRQNAEIRQKNQGLATEATYLKEIEAHNKRVTELEEKRAKLADLERGRRYAQKEVDDRKGKAIGLYSGRTDKQALDNQEKLAQAQQRLAGIDAEISQANGEIEKLIAKLETSYERIQKMEGASRAFVDEYAKLYGVTQEISANGKGASEEVYQAVEYIREQRQAVRDAEAETKSYQRTAREANQDVASSWEEGAETIEKSTADSISKAQEAFENLKNARESLGGDWGLGFDADVTKMDDASLTRRRDELQDIVNVFRSIKIPDEYADFFNRLNQALLETQVQLKNVHGEITKSFDISNLKVPDLSADVTKMGKGALEVYKSDLKAYMKALKDLGLESSNMFDLADKKLAETDIQLKQVKADVKAVAEEEMGLQKEPIEVDLHADVAKMSLVELTRYLAQLKIKLGEVNDIWKESNYQATEYDGVWNKVTDKIKETTEALNNYGKSIQVAEETQKNLSNADILNTIEGTVSGIGSAKNMLEGALNVIRAIGPAVQTAGLISETVLATVTSGVSLAVTVVNQLVNVLHTIGNVLRTLWGIAKQVFSAIQDAVRRVIEAIKDLISKIGDLISKVASGLKNAFDKAKNSADKAFSSSNLRRTFQMLTKYIFGVRSFFFLYRKLRSGIAEGLKNLVQFESESNLTNKAITELRTSLLYLKNAWAVAFAPIINYVYPVLVRLMDMLASIGNAIARFIGALTGQATVLQAIRVGAGDYAESLNDIGNGAGNASKAQDELNDKLATFDDLNVLGVDDDKKKSGAGGGGGADDLLDPNEMFRRIETPVSKLADLLREAWKTGDAFDLGDYFAKALEKGLYHAHEWLIGEGREQILKIGNLIGTFFDGALSHTHLGEKIGQVLADAFNLGLDFINTVITPDRMYKVGWQIAEAFNEAIPRILPKLGETLGNLFRSAISNVWGFISHADFAEWGRGLSDAINTFMEEMSGRASEGVKGTLSGWQLLGMSVTEFSKSILDFFISAIEGVNWSEISLAIQQFLEGLDWESIKSKLRVLWKTIWTALEEFSPDSSEFLGNLRTIFEGILGIVNNVKDAILQFKWESIAKSISEIIDRLAKADWDKIGESVGSIFSSVFANVAQAIPKITEFIMGLPEKLESLKSTISDIKSDIDTFLIDTAPKVAEFVGWIKQIADEFERTSTAIENVVNMSNAWTDLVESITGVQIDFKNIPLFQLIQDVGSAFDFISGMAIGSLPEDIKVIVNGFISIRNALSNLDGIVDGVTEFVETVSDKFDDFGFNIGNAVGVVTEAWNLLTQGPSGLSHLVSEFFKKREDLRVAFDLIISDFGDWGAVKDDFIEIADYILDKVGDFVQGFLDIPNQLSGLVGLFRGIFNDVIDVMNDFFSRVVEGRNSLVNTLSNMGGLSGVALSFASSGTISYTPIPHLAQGAVLPPNKPFLAMVGDQTNGTNIEAPLDTIKQAVGEEFAPYAEAIVEAVMQVVNAVNNKELAIGDKAIGQANQRYLNRQNIIKGTML